jgi:hypothetical protein
MRKYRTMVLAAGLLLTAEGLPVNTLRTWLLGLVAQQSRINHSWSSRMLRLLFRMGSGLLRC